jgi:hypothetical protein
MPGRACTPSGFPQAAMPWSATSGRSSASSLRSAAWPELRFARLEHDELVEHGEAEPADSASDSGLVRHDVEGPSDVTAVLELLDRR